MYSQAAWDWYLLCITILTFDFVINPSFLLKRDHIFCLDSRGHKHSYLATGNESWSGLPPSPHLIYETILQPHQNKAGNNSKRHWWWDPDAAQFSKHCWWGGLFLWNKKFTLFFFKVLCLNILHRDGRYQSPLGRLRKQGYTAPLSKWKNHFRGKHHAMHLRIAN